MYKPSKVKTVACPLSLAALETPHAPALMGAVSMSYQELDRRVESCHDALRALSIQPGDCVCILAKPSPVYCVVLWALFRLGAVACPLHPGLPERQRRHLLSILQPTLVLADEDEPTPADDIALQPLGMLWNEKEISAHTLRRREVDADTSALIILTSGSTGTAKAAALSLHNLMTGAIRANANLPLAPGDCWLLSLPLYHVSGIAILFRCVSAGAAVYVPHHGLSLDDATRHPALTHVSLVPTQLKRLVTAPESARALSRYKGVVLGGAPLDSTMIDHALTERIPLVCSYGMTETAAQCCATRPNADKTALQSSGSPLASGTVRISDDGIIEVRGDTLFLGYRNKDGALERPHTADGWFPTGDLGRFDQQGRLHVLGRADAMFVSGGENIYPEEIEAALCTLPNVRRAVVVAVPHHDYGATPVAFVDMSTAALPNTKIFREALTRLLPNYKIPRHYLAWPEDAKAAMKVERARFSVLAHEALH